MGHYYNKQGEPVYTVPNASKPGEMRPTTKRDASKLDLVPSVTTYTGIIAKPALIDWFKMQVLETCYANPLSSIGEANVTMSVEDYASHIMPLADELRMKAADHGTAVHDAIEKFMRGEPYDQFYGDYVQTFIDWFQSETDGGGEVEVVFASAEYGFGGRIDILSHDIENRALIIDIKTQKNPGTKKDGTAKAFKKYPEYGMQMAAYWKGLLPNTDDVRLINFYMAADDPKVYEVYEIEDKERYWEGFKLCQGLWNFVNNWQTQEVAV